MEDTIKNKIAACETQTATDSLIPHLKEIEELVLSGYKLNKIAPYFEMETKKFYNALAWAKKKVQNNPDKYGHIQLGTCADTKEPHCSTITTRVEESKHENHKSRNLMPDHQDQREVLTENNSSNKKKAFNKEELMKKIKPSAFKHRFNIDLKHT